MKQNIFEFAKAMILYLFTLVLLFLSSACSHKNFEQEIEVFPKEKLLSAHKIWMDDVLSPDFMLLKDSNLLISNASNEHMLYQYNVPSFDLIEKSGYKGLGKNEFQIFPMFCHSMSDDVYIWGYTPYTIKKFTFENDRKLTFSGKNYKLKHYDSFNQMHIVKDSFLIYNAIPSELAIKKINLITNQECGRIAFKTDRHGNSFFYQNRGIVAANDSIIIYAYLYKKQIDLYRVDDLTLYKRLVGEGKARIVIGDFDNNTNYYVALIAGKQYFYALCEGENNQVSRLEVFDYEGHSIIEYAFDIVPYLFEIDEEKGILYGYNSDYEDYFLKYDLH